MVLIWQGWQRQAETCRSVFKEPSRNCLINLKAEEALRVHYTQPNFKLVKSSFETFGVR